MKLIGLLSWYREQPDFLRDCIISFAGCGGTHLLACDGAYKLFPDAATRSSEEEHEAIRDAAEEVGVDWRLYIPKMLWRGEVKKRSFMFRKAEKFATPEDWYFVLDGDYLMERPRDLQPVLVGTDLSAATVSFYEPRSDGTVAKDGCVRALFRALPGLRCQTNHYTYVAGERCLWGREDREEALDLRDVLTIRHRTLLRDTERFQAAKSYYDHRERRRVEHSSCRYCVKPGRPVQGDWTIRHLDHEAKTFELESGTVSVCDDHRHLVEAQRDTLLRSLGADSLAHAGMVD